MTDLWMGVTAMEGADPQRHLAIGHGETLTQAQIIEPRGALEALDPNGGIVRILQQNPAMSAIAAADAAYLAHGEHESIAVFRGDVIFHRDDHRAALRHD